MKLYQKLQERDLVDSKKEYSELIWLRAIRVNKYIVNDPNYDINDEDDIQVGILSVD